MRLQWTDMQMPRSESRAMGLQYTPYTLTVFWNNGGALRDMTWSGGSSRQKKINLAWHVANPIPEALHP